MCMDVIKWGKTRMVQNNNTNSKRLSILVKPDNIAIRCLDLLTEEENDEKAEEEIDERFISIKEGNSQKDYYFDDLQSIFV